jgi:hypothetical protein
VLATWRKEHGPDGQPLTVEVLSGVLMGRLQECFAAWG